MVRTKVCRFLWQLAILGAIVITLYHSSREYRNFVLDFPSFGTKEWTTGGNSPQSITKYVTLSTNSSETKQTRQPYICMNFSQRLGNYIFRFASLLGIARSHMMTPVISVNNTLRRIFKINVGTITLNNCLSFQHFKEQRASAFEEVNADFSRSLRLTGFYQSWKYFRQVHKELKKQLSFQDHVIRKARETLVTALLEQHERYLSFYGNWTFVGVHVRRDDYLRPNFQDFGYLVANQSYILKAMNYFEEKFNTVMFVVCSNDMAWSRENIPAKTTTFVTSPEAEVDLAVLSMCNHTIMTVGTFGWWAGWLAGGITLYLSPQVRPGSELQKYFNETDYIPPQWIPFDNRKED